MKKLCLLLALLLCLTSVSALADEFQLRDGIFFGDSLDTVKGKVSLVIEDGSRDKDNKVWFDGTVTGRDCATRFDFNETTGGLTDMMYSFGHDDAATQDEHYQSLFDGLVRKYGEPLANTDGAIDLITGISFDHFATLVNLYKEMLKGGGSYTRYNEWIVNCGAYSVKIDMISFYYHAADRDNYYTTDLSYHYYTPDDLEQVVRENQQQQSEFDNDL